MVCGDPTHFRIIFISFHGKHERGHNSRTKLVLIIFSSWRRYEKVIHFDKVGVYYISKVHTRYKDVMLCDVANNEGNDLSVLVGCLKTGFCFCCFTKIVYQ